MLACLAAFTGLITPAAQAADHSYTPLPRFGGQNTTGWTDDSDSGWTWDLIDWNYTMTEPYRQNNGGNSITTFAPTLGGDGWPRMTGWSTGDYRGPWTPCQENTGDNTTCSLKAFYDPDDTTHPEYRQSSHRNVAGIMAREDVTDKNLTTTTTFELNSEKYRYSYDQASNSMHPYTASPACKQAKGRFFPFNTLDEGCTVPLVSHLNNDPYTLDYFFGMHGRMDLTPGEGGLAASGASQTFEFAGDDNLLLYIDGVLLIDLGGWRGATPATLDLHTGEIHTGPVSPVSNGGMPIQNGSTRTNPLDGADRDSTSLYAAYHNALGDAGVGKYLTQDRDGVWRLRTDMSHKVDVFYSDTNSVASSLLLRTTFTDKPRYPLAYDANGGQGTLPKQNK